MSVAPHAARLSLTAVAAAALVLGSGPQAFADASAPGHHCSKYDGVAVRTQPDGTARDHLAKNQTFQVERIVNSRYTYGYKIVNGVHGYVLRTSLNPC